MCGMERGVRASRSEVDSGILVVASAQSIVYRSTALNRGPETLERIEDLRWTFAKRLDKRQPQTTPVRSSRQH